MQGKSWFRILSLIVGFAFLYIPIATLIVYSFNASKLVTVWGGFPTEWYGAAGSPRGWTGLSSGAQAVLSDLPWT